jgi:aldose sugar dehydrogenase
VLERAQHQQVLPVHEGGAVPLEAFGIAVDPVSGSLWDQQNADDAFDELDLVERGMNGGWIQINGPGLADRAVQGHRADAAAVGRHRRGAAPADPLGAGEPRQLAQPGGIGFHRGRALGPQYRNDLFAGAATPLTAGGYRFHFNLTGNRREIAVQDPRLDDRVADNNAKHDITESESLRFGTGFGVSTDIETGPNGNLFVVSLSAGAVYEIFRR